MKLLEICGRIQNRLNALITTISSKLWCIYYSRKQVQIGRNVKFYNKAFVNIHWAARLVIADNVTINSRNEGYHVSMYSRCKIMADRPHALIEIGENTRFHGSCIHAYERISIGKNCLIAANCQIMDGNGHDISFEDPSNRINTRGWCKPVVIEDNVWLATGVVVLPGVTIGQGSVITANSVVHKDIPPMVVAGGNPIRVIKAKD